MLISEAVQNTRRMVYGSMSEQINLLHAEYARDDTRLTFELDISGIQPSMILSCGLNEWWVKEIDAASKTVFVVPRWNGSYADPMPVGSIVYVRPRATDWQLFNEVNRAIKQMSSRTHGLYRMGSETLTSAVGAWRHFTVASTDVESILRVLVRSPWQGDWRSLQDRDWRFDQKTRELRLLNPDTSWMNEVQIVYRAPFRAAQGLNSDLQGTCGLAPSMEDIPALGAAANILLTTEGRRGQLSAQGDTRRAEEVAQSHNSSAAREMRRQFEQRCDDEAARLLNATPYRMSI